MDDEEACIAEDEHRQSADALVAAFSDSAIGSEDPGAFDLMPNQPRGGSADDTDMVDVGTEMKGKEPVGAGSQLNHDIQEKASTSTPPTVHGFKDGPRFHTGSDKDGCDDGHILDLSISSSVLIPQPSGVDVGPRRAESATKTLHRRKGVYQLRTSPEHS
jgi:hypothetical protein